MKLHKVKDTIFHIRTQMSFTFKCECQGSCLTIVILKLWPFLCYLSDVETLDDAVDQCRLRL